MCFAQFFVFFFFRLARGKRQEKRKAAFFIFLFVSPKSMSCQSCGGKPSTFCFTEGVAYCEACNAR